VSERTLYPPIEPYQRHTLQVDDEHRLYVEESGNPSGLPIVFLHGGPGAACRDKHRRFFNPQLYRIVLFDQRGCGRSEPHAALQHNTTQHLIDDLERIRIKLGIEQWLLFGGSWGATLALAYAQTYPQRCLGLILRGIFLCRERDIAWSYQDGASFMFPEFWQDYQRVIPPAERCDRVAAYYRRLTSTDRQQRLAAAKAWARWGARTSSLYPPKEETLDYHLTDQLSLSLARLECHYFVNHAFLKDRPLLNHTDPLADIPGVIIHGRYDVVCPIEQAWLLHQRWPQAKFHIITAAGHGLFEPAAMDCLMDSTDAIGAQISR